MALPKRLMPCQEWKPSEDFLLTCKSSTREYNLAHYNS